MYVKHHMSSPALTITPDTPFQDALKLMHERKIRRLPVVDRNGKLIGIVSERDLLHAAPSPATSLSVWELNYLLWKLTVKDLMATKVLTVAPDALLQEAATIMLEKKIGGLPVVDQNQHVVGVITETDIFKALVDMLETEQLIYA
ncbi:MAG: CBS domain-containing protein [Caldilineaceae bacterium]